MKNLNKLEESSGETEHTHSEISEFEPKILNQNVPLPKPYQLQTNWGKRNSTDFLNRVKELKENKIDPSFLRVKKPNNNLIIDSIKGGLERDQRKERDIHEREVEYEK